MRLLLEKLQAMLPDVTFEAGTSFCWSPEQKRISYAMRKEDVSCEWALLHEAAHGLLGHQTYSSDFELLTMEVAAWKHAAALGQTLGITIDEEHIQDCLDTYRDWLHRRSTCPTCGSVSLQRSPEQYACHNCPTSWRVTQSRFCRPYRKKVESYKTQAKKSDTAVLHPTFI